MRTRKSTPTPRPGTRRLAGVWVTELGFAVRRVVTVATILAMSLVANYQTPRQMCRESQVVVAQQFRVGA
jgi:hypothetical protein